MNKSPEILIVDDDEGHAILVRDNLRAAGLNNSIQHFTDGQSVLDFFFDPAANRRRHPAQAYLVLLDIRMPKVDGTEVLKRLKADPELRTMPVVVLTLAGRRYEKILSNVEEVRARGGYIIAVAAEGDTQILEKAREVFFIPETSEDLSPLLGIVPLQLLAYYIALMRGCDVDQPRNLAKSVTVE